MPGALSVTLAWCFECHTPDIWRQAWNALNVFRCSLSLLSGPSSPGLLILAVTLFGCPTSGGLAAKNSSVS